MASSILTSFCKHNIIHIASSSMGIVGMYRLVFTNVIIISIPSLLLLYYQNVIHFIAFDHGTITQLHPAGWITYGTLIIPFLSPPVDIRLGMYLYVNLPCSLSCSESYQRPSTSSLPPGSSLELLSPSGGAPEDHPSETTPFPKLINKISYSCFVSVVHSVKPVVD